MTVHNNALQRPHLRKHWQKWVRTWFNQPARKLRRITKRRQLAKDVFPAPIRRLRPTVAKCTFRYAGQQRLGRGFTLQELAEAKLNPRFAATIGIAVDHRRTNKSVEGLQRNVARLRDYISKLTLLPRREGQPRKGTRGVLSDKDQRVEPTQETRPAVLRAPTASLRAKPRPVTAEQNAFRAHGYLRLLRAQQKQAGKKAKE